MKRCLLLLFIISSMAAVSQTTYNNEWIDYSKTYYKFPVPTTGLYRIPQSLLSGYGLATVNADHFQLWRNGKQIPLYTSVQNQPLGGSDFIEFFGEMNDGKPDKELYRQQSWQLNEKWSLLTDTASYFLTVNSTSPNFRLSTIANNIAGNTLAPEPYFIHTAGIYYRDRLSPGRSELVGDAYTYSSSYDVGEGFTSNLIGPGATLTYNAPPLNTYTGPGAPQPVLKVNAAGWALHARYMKVSLNNDSVYSQPLDFFDDAKATIPLTVAQLSSGTAKIDVLNTCPTPNDRMVVATTELTYARQFNFGGANTYFQFSLPANSAGNYLEISNFNYSGGTAILYDVTNGQRYVGDVTNPSLIKFALTASTVARNLILVNQAPANTKAVASMTQRNFINFALTANQGNYLIISHPSLTTSPNGNNPVDDYRAYRSSAAGGQYNAKIYMADQLIDQFGFGIKVHPSSVRNFIRWARVKWNAPLQYVLLLGRGVSTDLVRYYETQPNINLLELVPTFGFPASDNLLTAAPGSSIPLTPIGRIAAINGDEINVYLNKLKEYEQVQKISSPLVADKSWIKNVVHVAGASDDGLNDILVSLLDGYKRTIEDTLFGANVHSFSKRTANSVDQLSSSQLTALFNQGISLLTYFGHSSSTTLEFNLDNPLNYNNKGKYPVFIVMGCDAGNFYGYNLARLYTKETLSERYVLAPERGSIAFLASTSLGIVHYLDIYNTWTYRSLSNTLYGKSLGQIMGESIRRVFAQNSENDFYARFQCEEFSLHGDPAVTINHADKPDYVVEDQMIKISPSFVSLAEKDFKVSAAYMNMGKAVNDSIVIEVKRTYPNLTSEVIRRDTVPGIRFMDSLYYSIPINPNRDKGLNKLTFTVDALNKVDELYETNNSVTKDVYIFEDEARPVYPYNYSIVNQQNIKFVASSSNAFAVSREYVMEMDTTETFNSSLKITRSMTSAGGVFEFTPGVTFLNNTVYYWRVSPKAPAGLEVWSKSSFIYMSGPETGFNQSHYYQHLQSDTNRIKLSSDRVWHFGLTHNNIFLRNGVYPTTSGMGGFYTGTINDAEGFIGPGCNYNELIINIIDPITMKAWKNDYSGATGLYQSYRATCGGGREYNFQFLLGDSAWRRKAANFIDSIPDGHIIVIRNNGDPTDAANTFSAKWKADQATWGVGNTLYDKLFNLGFADIDSFNHARSFIMIAKKNKQSELPTKSRFSDGIYDGITLNVDVNSPDTLGYITSPLLGPSKAWKTLSWRGRAIDNTVADRPTVDVIGVNNQGLETVVAGGLSTSQQDYDLSSVDPKLYPYIKLRMRNQDSLYFTPYQLDYWRVYYNPVPEGAVAPNLYYASKDTVDVGEPFTFGIAFKNISQVAFDSVRVKLSVTDKNNVENIIPVPRQKNLAAGDTIKLMVPVDTRSFSGKNTLSVNFNPDYDQPEQTIFNNVAFRELYVRPDSLSPLMDVTFDGTHILNRDIVSSRPDILIRFKDEAKWLVLDDTALFTIQVRFPDGTVHPYRFNTDTIQFIPAGRAPNPQNEASINFKPSFFKDGEYELIVTGKDRSENAAGAIAYHVSFQVINKAMISNMLNYPNPFTTSTAFVFTLTGSEVPQNIRIQILTITGKIVREIRKEELGPLHIGRNMTEFKWDGTDEYGDQLANGIYLYRVITNLNGKTLDKYKQTTSNNVDNTDKYFNNGYGKMYLMR